MGHEEDFVHDFAQAPHVDHSRLRSQLGILCPRLWDVVDDQEAVNIVIESMRALAMSLCSRGVELLSPSTTVGPLLQPWHLGSNHLRPWGIGLAEKKAGQKPQTTHFTGPLVDLASLPGEFTSLAGDNSWCPRLHKAWQGAKEAGGSSSSSSRL